MLSEMHWVNCPGVRLRSPGGAHWQELDFGRDRLPEGGRFCGSRPGQDGVLQEGARIARPVVRSGDGATSGAVVDVGDDLVNSCRVGLT